MDEPVDGATLVDAATGGDVTGPAGGVAAMERAGRSDEAFFGVLAGASFVVGTEFAAASVELGDSSAGAAETGPDSMDFAAGRNIRGIAITTPRASTNAIPRTK